MRKLILKTEKGGGVVVFIQNYQLLTFFQDIFRDESYFERILFDGKQKDDNNVENVFEKYKKRV